FGSDTIAPGLGHGALVRDRLTGITEHIDLDTSGALLPSEMWPSISRDGRVFSLNDNAFPSHVYLRTPDTTDTASDLTGDGDQSRSWREALNTPPAPPPPLSPADQVAVANGETAFLRPNSAGSTPSLLLCPAMTGNPGDDVVHYWPETGSAQNLGLAATAVA